MNILAAGVTAREQTNMLYGHEAYEINANGDAFNHVTWSFVAAHNTDIEFSRLWFNAHEYGITANYEYIGTTTNSIMDLRNNAVGRAYAQQYPLWDIGLGQHIQAVIIAPGNAWMVSSSNFGFIRTDGTGLIN